MTDCNDNVDVNTTVSDDDDEEKMRDLEILCIQGHEKQRTQER